MGSSISGVFVRLLVDELTHRGFAPDELLDVADFDRAALDDPSFRLDFRQYGRIVGHALELTREPMLGLFAGTRRSLASISVIGQLASSCGTLREAAELLFRYQPLLVDGSSWELAERSGIASLAYRMPLDQHEHREYGAEVCVALLCGVIRPLRRGEEPFQVWLQHEPRGPVERYRAILGTDVRFGAEANAVAGNAAALDRPLAYGDAGLRDALQLHAERALAHLAIESELPTRLRALIRFHPRPREMTVPNLARAIGMSPRTLRRRILDMGVSLRSLVDTELCEIASAALQSGTPIKEVAFSLGYSDLSAFHRAFRRWTGMTPASFQERAVRR